MPLRPSMLLALTLLLIGGCYESPVPLAPRHTTPVDSTYLGRWVQTAVDTNTTPIHLVVQTADAYTLALDVCCADLSHLPPDTTRLQAFLTRVEDVTYANVTPEKTDSLYYFFRIDASSDSTLTLHAIGQRLFDDPPATSDALLAFVRRHRDDDRLYLDDPMHFQKVPPIDLERPFR